MSAMLTGRERCFAVLAWAYLVLLPCQVRLVGPLYLHDLLAPLFALAVVLRGDGRRWYRLPDAALAAFLLIALLVTVLLRPTRLDVYELAIGLYMALLYAFFSRTRLAPRALGHYAVAIVASLWAVGLWQASRGQIEPHSAYVGTTLGFLATRFGYRFGNPNLFGSFVSLPLACALLARLSPRPGPVSGTPGEGTQARSRGRRHLLAVAGLALAGAVPALLSASRHLLLSAALALGALPWLLPDGWRRRGRQLAWATFLTVSALVYLTVLIPFFPVQPVFPFVNARTPGMYLIHQDAYLRLATHGPASLLVGIGQNAVRTRYPEAVNRDLAARVLAEYRMREELFPSFVTYMDAHNEYLNLAVAFGLPAVLCLAVFLAALARNPGFPAEPAAASLPFFIAALAVACLWDDLLSKRWVWVTLGLLAASASARSAAPAAIPTGAAPRAPEASSP